MEVRIVSADSPAAAAETDYVRVETWCDPEQDTVTLATIERVVRKSQTRPEASAQRIKTLVQKLPMSPHDALGFARRYAERKKIGLVLTAWTMPLASIE